MKRNPKRILTILLCLSLLALFALPATATDQRTYHTDAAQAAVQLRAGLLAHAPVIPVGFVYHTDEQTQVEALMEQILSLALEHTGNPKEGDYIYLHLKTPQYLYQVEKTEAGSYYLCLNFTMTYRTTLEQEAQVDAKVEAVLDMLDVYDKSDVDKVYAIYNYICRNVDYYRDIASAGWQFTAFGALVNGYSVCQGYATLFYRLALELDVDCRVLFKVSGGSHAWNIVKLEGAYYIVDPTYDVYATETNGKFEYFLRGADQVTDEDHIPLPEYTTEEFQAAFPISREDYAYDYYLWGDMDGNGAVSQPDVRLLLEHTLFPDRFPLAGPADINSDGTVDVADARYLLRVWLYPTEYQPYPPTV